MQLKQRADPLLPLSKLREHAGLELDGLWLLRKGNRLSITPVDAAHFRFIRALLR